MTRAAASLLILLCRAAAAQAPDSLALPRVAGLLGAQLDAQLTRFAAYGFSGSVLVVREGQIVLLKGYGLADVDRNIPNTAATRFEMNSMTKMFTGVAILQLVGAGRIALSDPVERVLGDFPPGKRGATIAQLTTHTSGLIVEGSTLASDSRDAFVGDVKRTPRESAPSERYRYTNAGFSLLAAIIEVTSGTTYEDYLREHLFAPAEMRSAIFRDQVPVSDPLFAHGYVGTPGALEPGPPNPYVWGTRGAGGVWTTVGDIYRWVVALEQRRVLPEAQWRTLTAPPQPPAQEAFGWHVDTAPDGRARIAKGGGSDDFASQLLYYPRDRIVVIWASNNLRQRWRRTLNDALPGAIFGGGRVSLPPVITLSAAALEARTGRYVVGGDTVELKAASGYLYAAANRARVPVDVMFFPQSERDFTGFDPAAHAVTRLDFGSLDRGPLTITFADGRRLSAMRL